MGIRLIICNVCEMVKQISYCQFYICLEHMGNTLPCCTDNDNAQTTRLDKKKTSPQKQKTKATKTTTPAPENKTEDIFEKLKKFGQNHLIEHYNSIQDQAKKAALLAQIKSVDYQQATQLYQHVYLDKAAIKEQQKCEFSPVSNIATYEDLKTQSKEFEELGIQAISRGEVAVCIMSGGQGTRLGFDHPKGMFNLGLQSGLTLFGFFANRLARLNEIVCKRTGKQGTLIKWYMMTSQMNHQEIVTYFSSNNYFGYDKDSIVFFPQGGIPALFYDGKVVIESEGNISLAPGGNGAIYGQMKNRGVLAHMAKHGVKYINIGPVDNVLFKLADPISLGYMVKNSFDIVSHYLRKRSADEKVGLHLTVNGKIKILEYSQTDSNVKESKNNKGEFIYNHGARATMYITRAFIEHLTNDPAVMLSINKKYHLAEKKIKHWSDSDKKVIAPEKNNGVKFELFYFDVFEETNKIGLFETLREQEFAPLKNATGEDSPATAKEYLEKLHRKWLTDAGVQLQGEGRVQIHPRRSYNGQGLLQWVQNVFGTNKAKLPLYIE